MDRRPANPPPWRPKPASEGHGEAGTGRRARDPTSDEPKAREPRGLRPKAKNPRFAAEGRIGGCGGSSPHSEPAPGKRVKLAEQGNLVAPLAGGDSEGGHTVRPWGGRPVPSYSKAFPQMWLAHRRWAAISP
jgi:hypothetical protein